MIDKERTTASVRQRATMRCAGPTAPGAVLEVELGYAETDPYAVTISFGDVNGGIVWTFARDLLLEGLAQPVGDGDVAIWPAVGQFGGACVMVEFRSPDGELLVETSSRGITQFVNRTLELVPRGAESRHLDMDSLIDHLLAA